MARNRISRFELSRRRLRYEANLFGTLDLRANR
jgi:hypothetical protein